MSNPEFIPNLSQTNLKSRVEICDGMYLEFDPADTWVAIGDLDWMSYDQAGAVLFNVKLIDAVIEKLTEVRDYYTQRDKFR